MREEVCLPCELIGPNEALIMAITVGLGFGALNLYLRDETRLKRFVAWRRSDACSAKVLRKSVLVLSVLASLHVVVVILRLVLGQR